MKALIVGYGSFGSFFYHELVQYIPEKNVSIVFDKNDLSSPSTKRRAANVDVVFNCASISAFEDVAQFCKRHAPQARCVDFSSVKEYPAEVVNRLEVADRWLLTHPLFGPGTTTTWLGQKIVLCSHIDYPELYDLLFNSLGLFQSFSSPEEHDTVMAYTQLLSHFVGKALPTPDITLRFNTPSGERLDAIRTSTARLTTELVDELLSYNKRFEKVKAEFLTKLTQT